MGRRKRNGNHSPPQKNNLIQDSEGNEENRCQFQNPTKQR
jgi:hypothetical protein